MTRSERVRYEMLQRILGFGTSHAARFPESSAGALAFAELARIITTIAAHAARKIVLVGESRRQRADGRKTMLVRMKAIVRTSRGIMSEAGTPLAFKMPKKTSDVAIITGARALLQQAEPYQSQLVGLGLAPGHFAELQAAADAFDLALKDGRAGRSGVAGAQAGIAKALSDGVAIVRTLDIIVVNLLQGDEVAMASWKRDRRVVNWRGPKAVPEEKPAEVAPGATEPVPAPLGKAS